MISKVKPAVPDTGEKTEWFESWFDSPYYHILYQHRDQEEAEGFLSRLLDHLKLPRGSRVLDIACGKGRHAVYLHEKGYDVSAFDLSEQSISFDKQFESDHLHFYLHDMREVFRVNYFDAVFNLFSSFGYFEKDHDNYRCIEAAAIALRKNGYYILDYFNSNLVRRKGSVQEEKILNGICFKTEKSIEGDFVQKNIEFNDGERNWNFREKVRLFSPEEFINYFNAAGLEILETFGDYDLNPFSTEESPRMILLARKAGG